MGKVKRNLLMSVLLLVVMGIFAVLTIFVVVDAVNKKYYEDLNVDYEVQEEAPNIILTFARHEGSEVNNTTTKVVLNEEKDKFRLDGIVPEVTDGTVTNLDAITNENGGEFYFFSTNPAFINVQETPEDPNLIFNDTDTRYYVSTEENPIWYDVPTENVFTLYSVFLTPNVHNADFASAPLLNTSADVIISHDVVSVPYNAFGDLSGVMMGGGDPVVAQIESVVLPNSVKSIESKVDMVNMVIGGAFAMCTSLQDIIIPSSVEYVGGDAFLGCTKLKTTEYQNGHYLLTENGEHIVLFDTNLSADNVTIHKDCISIQGGTFSKYLFFAMGLIPGPSSEADISEYVNIKLQSIVIPRNVRDIGVGAFMYCVGLENILFEENSKLESIGYYTFGICESLTSITIPSIVTSIGDNAFSNCTGLTSITIPSGVTSIGYRAFYSCTGLNTITFEEGSELKSIGDSAFSGCSSLISIAIPESVTSIGSSAFRNCTGLTSITIPSSVTSIGYYVFEGCTGLTTVSFENMTGLSIGSNVFNGCSNAETLTILSGEVKDLNFSDFTNLTTVTLGEGVTSIGSSAFHGCDSLTSITIPSSVTSIGSYAFYNCESLTSITIPSTVTSIGSYAFWVCTGLTSITIPSGVTSIGSSAFSGCDNLTIYCEVASRPSGWNSYWNYSNRPVYWAGEWEYDEVMGEPRPIE